VISQLDNDTVLFVLGDHGMTSTGDHGGDSYDELDATLFVYSSSPVSDSVRQQVRKYFLFLIIGYLLFFYHAMLRHCAVAGVVYSEVVCLSVCRKLEFYQNG